MCIPFAFQVLAVLLAGFRLGHVFCIHSLAFTHERLASSLKSKGYKSDFMIKFTKLLPLKVWLIIAPLLWSSSLTFAADNRSVSENATVTARISTTELTRIAVAGDRIRALRGTSGAYSVLNDALQGAVFIQPLQSKPFFVFVSTEHGHNYLLRLTPSDLPADMLILTPKGKGRIHPPQCSTCASSAQEGIRP